MPAKEATMCKTRLKTEHDHLGIEIWHWNVDVAHLWSTPSSWLVSPRRPICPSRDGWKLEDPDVLQEGEIIEVFVVEKPTESERRDLAERRDWLAFLASFEVP
jgi:hypothetical protein